MFTLDRVVPWGRSFDEYRRMFVLRDAELRLSILGCGDGPASFNAEATRRGARVVSADPLYRCDTAQIRDRIAATYDEMIEQTRQNAGDFVWDSIRSVAELGALRMTAMEDFLSDYDRGKAEGRYVDAELPALPFPDCAFDLTVCSHFLFLYSDQLGEAFHTAAIRELTRVAADVRIFPLLSLGRRPCPYVEQNADLLRRDGFEVSTLPVPYEFVRGGNQMMRITRRS